MHLQFIGCGDAFGSGGRFNTCFHLVGRGINALIDCGATSLVALNKHGIDRNAIDLILITHFHTITSAACRLSFSKRAMCSSASGRSPSLAHPG